MRIQPADVEFLLAQQGVVQARANAVLAELGKQANDHAAKAAELFALSRDLALAIQANDRALRKVLDQQETLTAPPDRGSDRS